jgi:antitoxin component of MazEF toxin-antitoxin module
MIGKVQRRDGELIVVIPEEAAKTEGIEYMTLDEMCDKITPETLHAEIDWGPDVGKEIVEY